MTLKELYKDTKVKTACWQMVNCAIVITLVAFGEMNGMFVVPMTAVLNMATKEINKRYL